MGEFVTVARIDEVSEGALAGFEVQSKQVAIANVGGEIYAFGDVCSHEQCSLSEGDLEGTAVTCPCHGSQFDVTTGEVLNPPATEPVPSYTVRVEGGEIQVEM